MDKELRQRPLEPDLIFDLGHVRLDAGDFGQAECVNLLRRHPGGCRLFDHIAVQVGTTRHGRQPNLGAGFGDIVIGEKIAQPLVGWLQLAADHRPVSLGQARLVCVGKVCGKFLHRAIEGAALDTLRDQIVHLIDDILHHQTRIGYPGRQSLPHSLDRAVEQHGIAVNPLQIILIIHQRFERRRPVA